MPTSKNLKALVEDVNFSNEVFNRGVKLPKIDMYRIDAAAAKRLFERIEFDLSPENLCMDGEAPASYVIQRGRFLTGARNELIALGFQP